jgi:diguanylate cyclase (GGDEF)-like protein/PAS domain S-box-containing protein
MYEQSVMADDSASIPGKKWPSPETPPVVMVGDGNAKRRGLARKTLESSGFSVLMADDAARLWETLAAVRPALLLLDADFGENGGGYALCRALRHRPASQNIPVLMMITAGDEQALEQAYRADATDFVCKPLDWRLLPHRVRYLLRTYQLAGALLESEKRYSLAMQASQDGLWDWDLSSGQVFYSLRWKTILGQEKNEPDNTTAAWFERIHEQHRAMVETQVERHLKGHTSHFFCEYRIRHQRGHYLWVSTRGIAERDGRRQPIRFTGFLRNIDARKQAEEQLLRQAHYDDLTGLPNRRLLLQKTEEFLADSRGRPSRFALMYMDLDHFKTIKSSQGLAFSNHFLQAMSERLLDSVPADAFVGRYERDEFVVLIQNLADAEQAAGWAQRIVEHVRRPFEIDGVRVHSSVSLGLVLGPDGYEEAEDMLRDADTAVADAKKEGGNRFAVFSTAMLEQARKRMECEVAIQQGLAEAQFVPFYQPIIALPERRLAGFEALMRWRRPGHGIIMPGQFLDVAEQSGQILALGDTVIQQACRQTRNWLDLFPDSELVMHVNLSGKQFTNPGLAQWMMSVLQETGLPPRHLGLEITETALIASPKLAHQTLQQWRREDIHLAIDDFGAGYSSLSYLQQFPFNVLKIDRSFTSAIDRDNKTADIVQAVIKLAHKLRLAVVAEGIETEREAELLSEWGCDFGQGFLYAPALSEDDAQPWLAPE